MKAERNEGEVEGDVEESTSGACAREERALAVPQIDPVRELHRPRGDPVNEGREGDQELPSESTRGAPEPGDFKKKIPDDKPLHRVRARKEREPALLRHGGVGAVAGKEVPHLEPEVVLEEVETARDWRGAAIPSGDQ